MCFFFSSHAKYRDNVKWKRVSVERGNRGGLIIFCLLGVAFSSVDLLGNLMVRTDPSTCTSIKPQCGLYFLFLRLFFVGLYSHLALLSDVTIPTFFSSLADTFIESISALALWTEILNLMVCSFSGNIPVETEAAYLCVQCFRADATLVLQEAVAQDAILAANPIQEALLLRLPSPYSQLSPSKLLFDILYNELPA